MFVKFPSSRSRNFVKIPRWQGSSGIVHELRRAVGDPAIRGLNCSTADRRARSSVRSWKHTWPRAAHVVGNFWKDKRCVLVYYVPALARPVNRLAERKRVPKTAVNSAVWQSAFWNGEREGGKGRWVGKLRRTAIQPGLYPDSVSVCGIGAPVEVACANYVKGESACRQARRPLEKSVGEIFEAALHLLRKVRVLGQWSLSR